MGMGGAGGGSLGMGAGLSGGGGAGRSMSLGPSSVGPAESLGDSQEAGLAGTSPSGAEIASSNFQVGMCARRKLVPVRAQRGWWVGAGLRQGGVGTMLRLERDRG